MRLGFESLIFTRITWSDVKAASLSKKTYLRFLIGMCLMAVGNLLVGFVLQIYYGRFYLWLYDTVLGLFEQIIFALNVFGLLGMFFGSLYLVSRDLAKERQLLEKLGIEDFEI